jgi:hypothetical protein
LGGLNSSSMGAVNFHQEWKLNLVAVANGHIVVITAPDGIVSEPVLVESRAKIEALLSHEMLAWRARVERLVAIPIARTTGA